MSNNSVIKGLCSLIFALFLLGACNNRPEAPKVLVFSKTSGFYHESIPDGIQSIIDLG